MNYGKATCAVALPTAVLLIASDAVGDESLKATPTLFDTAAQQTLIHKQVVEQLNIPPIVKEWATLMGFGMKKVISKQHIL